MPKRAMNIGQPLRSREHRQDPRERLRDLDPDLWGREREEDIIVMTRDGQLRQRCLGGYRIIRKRTPE